MRNLFSLFLLIFAPLEASELVDFGKTPYSKSIKNKLLKGEIYVRSDVKDFKESKKQSFDFSGAGLHKKSCRYALKKLSLYENYSDYLDFVSESTYNDEKEFIRLKLETPILPIKMILAFKIPRIKKPGIYHYQFDKGFLKGLKGQLNITSHKKRCFFYGHAKWVGPYTGFNSTLFEFFSSTLGKLGIKSLFRISNTY